jgi:hypothetical protein
MEFPYIAEALRPLAVPIDDLHEDPANARVGHDLDRIAASLKAYGQRKPIIANRLQDGKIEAGNGTWRAAKTKLGWTHIAVVFVDDDPATAAAYGVADNRTAELSRWDKDALREISASVGDLFTGFEAAELDDLVGVSTATGPAVTDPETDPSRAEELQAKWQVQVGQVWRCGAHRILCGDSTQRSDVARLMDGELARLIWSDPPWNVNYGGGGDHPAYSDRGMNNDNGALRKVGFHWSSTIIWFKDALILSRKDYHTQYEPMWYGWDNRGPRLVKVEDRKISDVWPIDRPKKSEEHPTMKPLELVERSLANSSHVGDIVLDLFAGSGTTLLACEWLGRVCRTMDNDPKYVAVCLERWSVATGQTPVLEES